MLAAAGNMYQWKSEPFNQTRLNAVITAGRDRAPRSLQQSAQRFTFLGHCFLHVRYLSFKFKFTGSHLPAIQKVRADRVIRRRSGSNAWDSKVTTLRMTMRES